MATEAVTQACDDTEFLTCPVCLELFIKPVILECGHNFCKSCIEKVWGSGNTAPACPECREEFQTRKCTVNWLLAKQVEALKLRTESTKSSEVGQPPRTSYCVQHEEKLKLFCREDKTLACIICRDSAKHAGHSFLPLDEAASLYREKLTSTQAELQSRHQQLTTQQAEQKQRIMDTKDDASRLEQHIRSEFAVMYRFLQEREQGLIQKLKNEEANHLKKMEDNLSSIKEMITTIETTIPDIQSRLGEKDSIVFLTAVSNLSELCSKEEQTDRRYEKDLISDKLSFWHFKGPLQYSLWKEMKSVISPVPASLTLDCRTADKCLVLSPDLTSVQKSVPTENESLLTPLNWRHNLFLSLKEAYHIVLGSEGFSSGIHYWEVEVTNQNEWAIGVAVKSVVQDGRISFSTTAGHWAICFQHPTKYATCEPVPKLLNLNIKPQKIGVYLDYEGGQISFHNADMSHIHTFNDTFSECLYPSLCPDYRHCHTAPLKLFHLKL